MKSVQIPYELFVALVEYHLAYDDDCAEEIRQGLEQKLDALVRCELYAKYKTAPTPEEREQARQEYLDKRSRMFGGEIRFPVGLILPLRLAQKFSPCRQGQERVTLLFLLAEGNRWLLCWTKNSRFEKPVVENFPY